MLLVLAAGCNSHPPRSITPTASQADKRATAARSTAGNFDYFLLNLSWSPEYCHSHPTAAECAAHAALVLHGLWPQNDNGSYPENCNNAPGPADASQYSDIYPDAILLQHEWQTHGTCSGLGPDAFFIAARSAFHSIAVPPGLSGLKSEASLSPDQILGLFAARNPAIPRSSMALNCGHNYLTAVEVCVDKSLHPTACSGVRSCRASTVRITAP
jgi:ribonuclease T2